MRPDDSSGSILKGAGTGATAGSAAGPVGSVVGGVLGAVAGAITNDVANERQESAIKRANAETDLRNATAMSRQYKQALQLGLNPTSAVSLSPSAPVEANAPNLNNPSSTIASSLGGGFAGASSQLVSLENARENREMQDRLNRLSASGQLLGFHYQQTFTDYQLNQNFINDRQMKLKEVETTMTSSSSLSSSELETKKAMLSEQTQAFKHSALKVDETLQKLGYSLEQAEKDTQQNAFGIYANGSLSASMNPFKLLSGTLQVGGKYDHSSTIEQAKKAVGSSDLSKTEKTQALTELDELKKCSSSLESSVREMKQLSESVSNTVQRLGFNSYIDMLFEIEDLKFKNEELKGKLSPEYMFKKYQEYYQLNY